MRLFRYTLIAVLLVTFGVAIYQTMLWLGVWGNPNESQVLPLDDGEEIALIEPATSIDDWGRIVAALKLLEFDWPRINPTQPKLHIDLANAFPPRTADVSEIVFSFANTPSQKLRLRWYKISGEHEAASWVAKLHARKRAPLAIIGGGTSDRAVKLASTLRKTYEDPAQPSPVFLITTATAEKTKKQKSLIGLYSQRSFRFSFTNQKMVESLLGFIEHRQFPEKDKEWAQSLWVNRPADPPVAVAAGPTAMYAVTWMDERYSQDMNELFEREFDKRNPKSKFSLEGEIPYSAGGFFQPTPQEQLRVGQFLLHRAPITPNSVLVLPTQTVRMRRFLINLRQRSPLDARNLVILNGDAISFHSVYRDREVMWNILDLPYSLVFFAHRNPIDFAAGFTWVKGDRDDPDAFPQPSTTGTHDILLYRDLFEAFLYAAFDDGVLLSNPLQVRERLQATCWHHPPDDRLKEDRARVCNPKVHAFAKTAPRFFDAEGNRQSRTGEHIVWVRPNFTGDVVDLDSKISVWSMLPNANGGVWQLLDRGTTDATYNRAREEDVK